MDSLSLKRVEISTTRRSSLDWKRVSVWKESTPTILRLLTPTDKFGKFRIKLKFKSSSKSILAMTDSDAACFAADKIFPLNIKGAVISIKKKITNTALIRTIHFFIFRNYNN